MLAFLGSIFAAIAKALGLWSIEEERKAGAAISQNEASNAEYVRIQKSVDAGLSAERLPVDAPDTYDLDR